MSLRIALLGYRGNPYSGGQGIYLKYLSAALADLGHRVSVIGGPPYAELDAKVTQIKLPSLDLYSEPNPLTALRPQHLRSFADTFEWWSMITGGFAEPYTFGRRLLRWWDAHGSDFDVVHDNQSLCWALLKLQRRSVPLVTTIHHPITSDRDIALNAADGIGHRLLIRRWHSFLRMQSRVARQLNSIVTVSDCSRRDIAAAFNIPAERIRVVPNGIDARVFRPDPSIARHDERLISTASADQPLKGTVHLVRALAQLRERRPNLRLTLIGKPRAGGPTDELIRRLDLSAAIEFRSGLTTDEIRELYARSTVAVVPSEYEGFGLPAGEAMACGVPLVSTDGGALPEVVGDAGVIVPAGNPLALAAAIEDLLQQPERRHALSEAGRARIKAQFDWRGAAEAMTRIYGDAIGAGAIAA
ncbi:MAG: glycosyltransferase family 4 protein [Pseudomonadota bacterium]